MGNDKWDCKNAHCLAKENFANRTVCRECGTERGSAKAAPTRVCRQWKAGSVCKFGARCRFAHAELAGASAKPRGGGATAREAQLEKQLANAQRDLAAAKVASTNSSVSGAEAATQMDAESEGKQTKTGV